MTYNKIQQLTNTGNLNDYFSEIYFQFSNKNNDTQKRIILSNFRDSQNESINNIILTKDNSYLLNFSLPNLQRIIQEVGLHIKIYLGKNSDYDINQYEFKQQQLIKEYFYNTTDNIDIITDQISITPNDTYDNIIFDFVDIDRNNELLDIDNFKLYKIINLLPQTATKIGIQGPTGFQFWINNESIKLGKNGIYELYYDDMQITSIGVFPKFENEFFLIDYEYEQENI